MIKSKKGLEMSFSFIFAMIVGAAILFFAIYGVTKLIGTANTAQGSEVSKEISIMINPLQTSVETSKEMSVELTQETRIYDECYYASSSFGSQGLSVSLKSIGDKWGDKGAEIITENKYIFSRDVEEGKKLYLFSKGFYFPWKVADIIVMTSGNYCFVSPPTEIEEEILQIKNNGGMTNIEVNYSVDECDADSLKVCFDYSCNISVYGSCYNCENSYETGYVSKDGDKLYYSGNLIYGAIFSDKDLYECNVKRLMKRIYHQGNLLIATENIISEKCSTGLDSDINYFAKNVIYLNSSYELFALKDLADELDEKNSESICELW